MIKLVEGNIFDSTADALVNPVNCIGVMGAGLALEFKRRYPQMFLEYRELCKRRGEFTLGKMHYYVSPTGKVIVNFPTKDHWRNPSKMEYLFTGLDNFISTYKQYNIGSAAFPLLGCGLGGLDRNKVKALMIEKLTPVQVNAELYV